MASIFTTALRLCLAALLLGIEAVCWLGFALRQLVLISYDMIRGLSSLRGDTLRCREGHETPIGGDDLAFDLECSACGWRWSPKDSTALRCPNPECEKPSAPFVCCIVCGRSVRNPYRWGRP